MSTPRTSLLALILALAVAGPALAQGKPSRTPKPDFDRSLAAKAADTNASPNERIRVIIKYRGAVATAKSRLAGRVDRIRREHRSIGAVVVEMRRGRLAEICALKDLACSADAIVRSKSEDTTDLIDEPWTYEQTTTQTVPITIPGPLGLPIIQWVTQTVTSLVPAVDSVFDTQKLRATLGLKSSWKGAGVGIAVIDSGIAPVSDVAGRVTHFRDFTNGGVVASLSDGYGHGTHVAGLIAGNGLLSLGKYVGIAPNARLIGLKVLNSQGEGYTSDVIAAIDFAIANRLTLGIDVINLSLGHPVFEHPSSDPLVQAVQNATAAGIVVVVSAGNWGLTHDEEVGYGGITSPGNAPGALTVGAMRTKATATRDDDEIALFSSRGPTWYEGRVKPDVVAPGQSLAAVTSLTSLLGQNPLLQVGLNGYIKLSGTSMAAAVASGVVALMIEANRLDEGAASSLTPNTVKAILQYSALPVAETWSPAGVPDALAQGAGGINGAGAIELARAIDPAAPMGAPWLETAISPFTTIAGNVYTWAQGVVWGDHFVSGDSVTWNLPVWAQGVVWGDDDGVVWGDDDGVVWGDSFANGLNLVAESFNEWSSQIVWGEGVVWGDDDGVVWGDLDGIVWGDDDGVVWGDDDGIVWGDDDGIVWGDSFLSFLGL